MATKKVVKKCAQPKKVEKFFIEKSTFFKEIKSLSESVEKKHNKQKSLCAVEYRMLRKDIGFVSFMNFVMGLLNLLLITKIF